MSIITIELVGILAYITIPCFNNYKKHVKVKESEIAEKINTILSFLRKNEINTFEKYYDASDIYNILNKYSTLNIALFDRNTYSEKDLETFYYNCLIRLMSVLTNIDYREDNSLNIYNEAYEIYQTISQYNCYKEEMLFISWLLQIYYMYHKTDERILSKEQNDVLKLIKKEVFKIAEEEKKQLFEAFKEQNNIFNNFAKSLY